MKRTPAENLEQLFEAFMEEAHHLISNHLGRFDSVVSQERLKNINVMFTKAFEIYRISPDNFPNFLQTFYRYAFTKFEAAKKNQAIYYFIENFFQQIQIHLYAMKLILAANKLVSFSIKKDEKIALFVQKLLSNELDESTELTVNLSNFLNSLNNPQEKINLLKTLLASLAKCFNSFITNNASLDTTPIGILLNQLLDKINKTSKLCEGMFFLTCENGVLKAENAMAVNEDKQNSTWKPPILPTLEEKTDPYPVNNSDDKKHETSEIYEKYINDLKNQFGCFFEMYKTCFEQEKAKNAFKENPPIANKHAENNVLFNQINDTLNQLNHSNLKSLPKEATITIDFVLSQIPNYINFITNDLDNENITIESIGRYSFLKYVVYVPLQDLLELSKKPETKNDFLLASSLQAAETEPVKKNSQEPLTSIDHERPPETQQITDFQREEIPGKSQLVPQKIVYQHFWDKLNENLIHLSSLTDTKYLILPRQEIKQVADFLLTLEDIKPTDEISKDGCFFYIRDSMPKELEPYKGSFIFLTEAKLSYIKLDGEKQEIQINSIAEFIQFISEINPKSIENLYLSKALTQTLKSFMASDFTEEKGNKFFDQKFEVFSLAEGIETKYDTDIISVWKARTHEQESGWPLIEDIYKEDANPTFHISSLRTKGTSIGYLLGIGVHPSELLKAGISIKELRLAGVDPEFLLNHLQFNNAHSDVELTLQQTASFPENKGDHNHKTIDLEMVTNCLQELNVLIGTQYITLPKSEIDKVTRFLEKKEEDDRFMQSLINEITKKYQTNDIVSLWKARTHEKEIFYSSELMIYEDVYNRGLSNKLSKGLAIGYLLGIGLTSETIWNLFTDAGVSVENLYHYFNLSGICDNSATNSSQPVGEYFPPVFSAPVNTPSTQVDNLTLNPHLT